MEYICEGDLLEGAHCQAIARRPDMKGPKYDPITNQLMMLYELDRNCSLEVTKEMVFETEEEAELRIQLNVHKNHGDILKAKKMQMYVDTKNSLRHIVKEGVTATHGAHIYNISERTVGKIKYSLDMYRTKMQQLINPQLKAIL